MEKATYQKDMTYAKSQRKKQIYGPNWCQSIRTQLEQSIVHILRSFKFNLPHHDDLQELSSLQFTDHVTLPNVFLIVFRSILLIEKSYFEPFPPSPPPQIS